MVAKRGTKNSSKYSFNSKGQVTIFIIIGIIVLFTFAGILFISKVVTKEPLLSAGDPVISRVPQVFKPIQRYTENCLSQVGKRGLVLLGQQGGYINPEILGEYSIANPTEGEGLNFENNLVPYWHFNLRNNDDLEVIHATHQPKLKSSRDRTLSIESQLSRFVDEKLGECLNSYKIFESQGFKIDFDDPKTDVNVVDGSVNFLLEMEVKSSKGDADNEMNRFFVKVPIDLKSYYEIADKITQAQEDNSFLESQGLELLSIYSKKDINYFPPTSDSSYKLFSPLSWSESQLKQNYKELLFSYVPMLRFLGSKNFYYTTFPQGNLLAQKVSDNMVLPLFGADNLEISFDYFGWEPYFKTNSDDGIIKPEHIFINFDVLSFGHQRFETHYDISYPILVTIKDPFALGGNGYSFVFALESNIRNNQPAVSGEVREIYPRQISPITCNKEQRSTKLLKTVVIDSNTREPLELVKIGFSIPNFADCDIGITNSKGEVESEYPAAYGGIINFIKPGYFTSLYPIDTYNYQDSSAILGYSIADYSLAERVIELDRIVEKNVRVKKKKLQKCIVPLECEYTAGAWTLLLPIPYQDISCKEGERQCFNSDGSSLFLGEPDIRVVANGSLSQFNDYYFRNKEYELEDNEEVFLTLERVSGFHDEIISDPYTIAFTVNGDNPSEAQFIPGKYKVTGNINVKKNLVIPEDQRCFRYSLFGYDKNECLELEGNNYDNFMAGNLQWDLPETYLEITPEDLYSSNEITFYILSQDIYSVPPKITATARKCSGFLCLPGVGCAFNACVAEDIEIPGRVIEDLQIVGEMGKLSKRPKIREALQPVYD